MLLDRLGGKMGNVSLTLQGEALPWRPGQILQARVLEAAGEGFLLLLAGRKLRVQSQVPLVRGQELQLLVVGRDQGGRLILRIIASPLAGAARLDPARVEGLLGELGVEATPANTRLAVELLRQGLPVTPDILARLGSALGRQEPSSAGAAALVWLWGQGLPLKETFVKPLATLLQEGAPDLLQSLFPALAAAAGEGQEEGQRILQQLLLSPGREGGRALRDLPRRLGLDYEALLARPFLSPTEGEAAAGSSGTGVREPAGKKSLKALLLALGQDKGAALPAELAGLLDRITGLQLLLAGPWAFHCLGWLDLPGQAPPFFLSIREEEEGGGGGQGRPLEVVLFLSLPALGAVLVEMRCAGALVLSLTVEGEKARRILDGCRQKLQAALADLPWPVQVLPCRIQQAGTVEERWRQRLTSLRPTRRQVDVRI